MKGIILAGGLASRLYPATLCCTKAILPIYDKPMIYYSLSTLIQAGIKDVLIICTEKDLPVFERLLGDGSGLGISIKYTIEDKPRGVGYAFILAEKFIGKDKVCLIFSDNIYHGRALKKKLQAGAKLKEGCEIFGIEVPDPEKFGIIYEKNGKVIRIEEKPKNPTSCLAQTGLFFYDNKVVEYANQLKPSARGEYEITDINNMYIKNGKCKLNRLERDVAWLDTGSHESLLAATQYVHSIQSLTGEFIGCVEEDAFNMGFINKDQLLAAAEKTIKTAYGKHLKKLYDNVAKQKTLS